MSALFAGALMQIVIRANPDAPAEAHPQIIETANPERVEREAEPERQPAPPARRPDIFLSAQAGYGRGSLFDQAMTGPAAAAAIGISVPRSFGAVLLSVEGEYDALQTTHGIGIHRLAMGVTGGVRLWHFHLGAGLDVGSTWIARVSGSDLAANELFVGMHGVLGVDLFTIAGITPYIQGRADLNTVMPTLSANAGLRVQF